MFVSLYKILNNSVLLACLFTSILSSKLHGSNNEILENNESIYSLNGECNQDFSESEIHINDDILYPMACKYEYGEGIGIDLEKSLYFFNLAIEKNQPQAMYHLGYKYENGIGVKQNIDEAIVLYTKAMELNHSNAINQLGKLYENGTVVKQDFQKAAEFYSKSILIDENFKAMNNLGLLYSKGNGVIQDFEEALKYFKSAQNKASELEIKDKQKLLQLIDSNILEAKKNKKNMEENKNKKNCLIF